MNAVKITNQTNTFKFRNHITDKSLKNQSEIQITAADSVEISDEAQKITREDSLLINKSGNNFIIHFDSGEILQRTIKRGFLIVDDKKILLTDADKAKLAEVGEKVKQANKKSYMQALMSSNLEVERHNSAVMDRIARKDNRIMRTASRMMKGERVSPEDEKELILSDPELYIAAKAMSSMQKVHNEDKKTSRKNHYERIKDSEPLNYDMSIPKYKKFETQMVLSRSENNFEVKTITSATIN